MRYKDVENIVVQIVFQPYFQGVDDIHEKIGAVVLNPLVDGGYIQNEIINQFGFGLPCNILDLSTEELSKIIFNIANKRIQTKKISTDQPTQQPDDRLTVRQVCGYILQYLGTYGPLRRQIGHAEKFSDLRAEAAEMKKQQKFDDAFTGILNHFDVTLDPQTFNIDTKIYNIGTMLTNILIDKGMAISFEEEYQDVDLFLAPIRIATAFNCLTGILKNHFEFWAPKGEETKKLRRTLLGFKSYDEYNQFMVKEGIKVKVDKIIYEYSNLNCPFELRPNMSNFVIFPWNANSIKQDIEQSFNMTIDYDISCSLVDDLYMHIYDRVKDSPDSWDKLFKRMASSKSATSSGAIPKQTSGKLQTKDETYTQIIGIINSKYVPNGLGPDQKKQTVHWNEPICNLLANAKNPNELKQLFKTWENQYKIKIDITDPKFTVGKICIMVHQYLVDNGRGEDLRVDIADTYAPWAAFNKVVDWGFIYSIWSWAGLKIPDNCLPNCHTFDEYRQIIITALHKTFDGTDLDVDRDILQKNLTFVQYKQLIEKRKNHGR